ncbi:SRPBCC family protein [Nocardioides pantholopis]|uniref:SRPBCC family protein n=1 Tax=Nocardioides pantholopis TaxID=2483798 RepID=UPI000F088B1F|nr:SRPBCC family protein [Nocardioides pantholopis]
MDLQHRFSVPTPPAVTWAHFNDIAAVAECFPGATVTSVEDDTFTGSVKVKLGPIALVYTGSGTFVEKDEVQHRFVVEARGKDKRGNGTAGATVTLTMTPGGKGTDVEVVTDLAVTGKPAQFGRGVMQDVSDKLLGQFVACLEQRLSGGVPAAAVQPAVEPPPGNLGPPAPPPVPPVAEEAAPASHRRESDTLDLGAAAAPALARAYGARAAAVLGGVLLAGWLLRRRRREHRGRRRGAQSRRRGR